MNAPLPLWLTGSGITYLKPTFAKKEEKRLVSLPIEIACDDGLMSFAETSMLFALNYLNKESVSPDQTEAVQHIQTWQSYTLYPNVLRDANLFRKHSEQHLLEDGKNWVSVLHGMQSSAEGQAALGQVYAALRVVMPAFKTLKITEAGNYLIPTFQVDSYNAGLEYGLDPKQLSDGTLRLFGILLAAYQVPRPSLLIIEEPEQTIYPGALRLLADVFKEISTTTQVILTTHSPHLVQQFAPDQIRVATMQDGVTQIRNIHPHQKEAVEEGLLSLEEFMTQGGLQPDDVPASPA